MTQHTYSYFENGLLFEVEYEFTPPEEETNFKGEVRIVAVNLWIGGYCADMTDWLMENTIDYIENKEQEIFAKHE